MGQPGLRLVTVILISCGLRVADALALPRDCFVSDADGAPYLRYYNHKMSREALVPIDNELGGSSASSSGRWPERRSCSRGRPRTPAAAPVSSATSERALPVAGRLRRPRRAGQPVHLTPHQSKHTFGTRPINRDVPQEEVRRLIDHYSDEMTGHYARLDDTTIRQQWEPARRSTSTGGTVVLDPDGPMAEAAWIKQRLARPTLALPNGYCSLPLQKSCQHANACLTCPIFVTTDEFLPEAPRSSGTGAQIIAEAEARGRTRLVEMNRQVLTNLNQIIARPAPRRRRAGPRCGLTTPATSSRRHAAAPEERLPANGGCAAAHGWHRRPRQL